MFGFKVSKMCIVISIMVYDEYFIAENRTVYRNTAFWPHVCAEHGAK